MSDEVNVDDGAAANVDEPTEDGTTPSDAGDGAEAASADAPADDAETAQVDPLDELINTKYGGDRKKFVNGLHEGWQSSSRLHDELKATKGELAQLRAMLSESSEPDEPVDSHPDVQRVVSQISAVDANITKSNGRINQILTEAEKLNRTIASAQAKIDANPDDFRASIDLSRADSRLAVLQQEYSSLESRIEDLKARKDELAFSKTQAEQRANASKQENRRQQLEIQRLQQQENDSFYGAIAAEAAALNLGEEDAEYFASVIVGELTAHLNRDRGRPRLTPAELADFAKGRAAAFAKFHKLRTGSDFASKSKQKVAASRNPAAPKPAAQPRPAVQSPPTQRQREDDPNYWRERRLAMQKAGKLRYL